MFTRILVPTDFSAPSDAALACARRLAAEFDASLHLLHVMENIFLRAMVADPRTIETAALQHLHDRLTADDLRRGGVTVLEKSDEPADEIVSYARSANIDLIVMGTRGRSGLAHVLVGSVAEHVVRTSPCPVLTIHKAPSSAIHTTGADHVHSHTRSNRLQRPV